MRYCGKALTLMWKSFERCDIMNNKEYTEVKIVSDNTIKAVLDEDFDNLLKSLNVYDSVVSGNEKCCICGKTVTTKTIAALFPYQGEVKFCCDLPSCISKLTETGQGNNG
jgi:hypothetical protein